MGNSVDLALTRPGITEVIAYEVSQDIADVYIATHTPLDPKLTIIVDDAFQTKPPGTFDIILYEINMTTRALWDEADTYLTWSWQNLNSGGHIIMVYDGYTVALFNKYSAIGVDTILTLDTGHRMPMPVWFIKTKG